MAADARVQRLAPRQYGGPRRAAGGLDVVRGEIDALRVEPVEMRRENLALVAKAEVVVTKIVDHRHDDVLGTLLLRADGDRREKRRQPM